MVWGQQVFECELVEGKMGLVEKRLQVEMNQLDEEKVQILVSERQSEVEVELEEVLRV